ncbi:hypothetical protein EVAR_44760_1 [Eumeta japonica]|uniref:Secreted protein n=1 Tax=Eumeta variegata TaxID=151549 RepID=A0A4C1XHE8_EUMVA|nr:hypothetical protein EVAR_44760_1 [Eumeta japonica]
MSSPRAGRRMKTSTMLLLNFILHPGQQASKFASFKFVMHTAPRAVEYRSRLFMNRQTSGGWWVAHGAAGAGAAAVRTMQRRTKRAFYVFNFTSLLICKSYYGSN